MILVIDNYDSFTYNLVQYLGELGENVVVRRNDQITLDEIEAIVPNRILISPGPGCPADAGISLALILRFGGLVVRASRVVHGKATEILHDRKSIFSGLDSPFKAGRYHSLVVERESLPACLEVSAETRDGVIMGLRHRDNKIEGVQFHPESILTPPGKTLLSNFLRL